MASLLKAGKSVLGATGTIVVGLAKEAKPTAKAGLVAVKEVRKVAERGAVMLKRYNLKEDARFFKKLHKKHSRKEIKKLLKKDFPKKWEDYKEWEESLEEEEEVVEETVEESSEAEA